MEQSREELAAQGYYIRKINQAYFAFTNLYAGEGGSPGATNPIGPKLDELRQRSGSLARFVDIAGSLTSVAARCTLKPRRSSRASSASSSSLFDPKYKWNS